MKQIYVSLLALLSTTAVNAQLVPNGDMETWRNSTSGSTAAIAVHAPSMWYGADSLIIGLGQSFGSLIIPPIPATAWHAQVFEESTEIHGGTRSAKLITVRQDTLGIFPGVLSTSRANVSISLAGGVPSVGPVTYKGGTGTTLRIKTVSAWVKYLPGKDSLSGAFGGNDTALLTVQTVCRKGTADSVVGTGFVVIPPSSTFVQVTANVLYPVDSVSPVDTVRIIFASSGAGTNCDSSILYVDDVTMAGVPQPIGVSTVAEQTYGIQVYPNPATDILHITGSTEPGNMFRLLSVDGRTAVEQILNGATDVDTSRMPAGTYLYSVRTAYGVPVQSGQVVLVR